MEAVILFVVPLIAVGVYFSARFSMSGRQVNPQEELARLQDQLAWHEDRLRRAKESNWDDGMIGQIAAQLTATQGELARVTAVQTGAFRRN
jgi:hypothetical protein